MVLNILFRISSFLLSLRYRVTYKNMEVFDTASPVILFPNHPALIDPIILIANIGKKKMLSPVMTETYFKTPGLGGILRALKTVPVGDLVQ